jgi:hypothetical protein
MTWLKLLGVVYKLAETIAEQSFPVATNGKPSSAILREVEALEAATSRTVDAAVRQVSRNNVVFVSSTEQYFLRQRILKSYCLLKALNTSWDGELDAFVPFPERAGIETAVEWLLIDVWNSTNREIWLAELKQTPPIQIAG